MKKEKEKPRKNQIKKSRTDSDTEAFSVDQDKTSSKPNLPWVETLVLMLWTGVSKRKEKKVCCVCVLKAYTSCFMLCIILHYHLPLCAWPTRNMKMNRSVLKQHESRHKMISQAKWPNCWNLSRYHSGLKWCPRNTSAADFLMITLEIGMAMMAWKSTNQSTL